MPLEESKCGDSCALVEMLASKTSKEQAIENAIAAVQTDQMTAYGAARTFKVPEQTLRDRLKKNVCHGSVVHATQKSKPARTKPTDEERQEWWRLHTEEGLTANAIHKKTGRNRETITKEIKRKEEALLESDHAPDAANSDQNQNCESPAAKPASDPPVETSENRMFQPEPLTPTGELSDEVKALIKREQQSIAERVSSVRHLRDFNQAATKHWEHLQRKFEKEGRPVISHNMQLVSTSLRQDQKLQPWAESLGIPGDSSYEDCVWATIKLARDLDKSMRLSLFLAGFIDTPGQMDRLHDS